MLQHLPTGLGRLLHNVRLNLNDLIINDPRLAAPETLSVTSAAFPDASPIPFRFTEDGDRVSPPIEWSGIPESTAAILVIIEDADSPTPKPLVHAIVIDKREGSTGLAEGEISEPVRAGSEFLHPPSLSTAGLPTRTWTPSLRLSSVRAVRPARAE